MSKLFKGGASFGFSLNYNTAVPVDTRFVVSTLEDLLNPETWVSGSYDSNLDSNNVYVVYSGLAVVVGSEKTFYIYTADSVSGPNISNQDSWARVPTSDITGEVSEALNEAIKSLGLNEDGSHKPTTGNYTSDATTITEEIDALDTELKKVNDKIGNVGDTSDSTIYGSLSKLSGALDKEIDKISSSSTLKETASGTYETALSIGYVNGTETTPAHLALKDKNGTELSTIPLSDILGNGILQSSSYDKTTGKLTLSFPDGDGGTIDVDVDLSSLLDINDILIDSDSQNYLDVDLTGGENSDAIFKVLVKKLSDITEESETGLADAADVKVYIDSKVSGLNKNATTTDGTNIHVTVSQTNGTVSIDSVSEDYSTITRTNYSKEDGVDPALTVTDPGKLVTGGDIEKVSKYSEDLVKKATDYIEGTINNLSGSEEGSDAHVKVKVETSGGEVSGVTVETNDIAGAGDLSNLSEYIKGNSVVSDDGDVSGGIEKRIKTLEDSYSSTDFTSNITIKDVPENIVISIAEGKDGKLSQGNSNVSVTYSAYDNTTKEVSDGVATGSLVKEIAEDLIDDAIDISADLSESDTDSYVTVSIKQENGQIKDLSVLTNDVASSALLGEITDDESKETAFGKIMATKKSLEDQISWVEID